MILRPAVGFVACLILTGEAFAKDRDEWLRDHMTAIETTSAMPPEDAIALLSQRLAIGKSPVIDEGQAAIFDRAQEKLLSIPGHATYFGRRMNGILDALADKSNPERNRAIYYNQDSSEGKVPGDSIPYDYATAVEGIQLLRFLPSPESVNVLGNLLKSSEGRNGTDLFGEPWKSVAAQHGVAIDAALTLSQIGIENPPLRQPLEREGIWDQVDAWKEWWREVETGKRTYRFKGSPVEYGPDGPVDPAKLKLRERDPARLAGGDTSHASDRPGNAASNEQPTPLKGVIAAGLGALLLLALAAWKAFSGKKTTAGS